MNIISKLPFSVAAIVLALITSDAHGASNITLLYSFTGGSDGANPTSALLQGADGALYGTTTQGGITNSANGGLGSGTVFCLTPDGVLKTLHAFSAGSDGSNPYGLIWGGDGCLYGTTDNGGYDERNNVLNGGTVFKITTNGQLTTLRICAAYAADGARPNGLAWGSDGNLYGTAMIGGDHANGVVFQMTPQGTLNYVVSFDGTNGSYPNGNLIQSSDGNLYGTAHYGGTNGVGLNGTAFRLTPSGALSVLREFPVYGNVLSQPNGSLLQGQDGLLYGTTVGSVFRVATNGAYSPLYAFSGSVDGGRPYAGLVQGTDGDFYGTTSDGGLYYSGTAFKITTNGVVSTLASFEATNGASPRSSFLLGMDGNFYGTTWSGGVSNAGTIFRLSVTPDLVSVTPPLSIILKSDAFTLTANLGTSTDSNITSRLESGDISGLPFEPALTGDYDGWVQPPVGVPLAGVQRIHIPPGDGANGFYKLSFVLPAGFWSPQLLGRASVSSSGKAFLNGNLIASNLDGPCETTNTTFFKIGTNELVISDVNYLSSQYGYESGAAFNIVVAYQPPPTLQVSPQTNGTLSFMWNAVVGHQYQLQGTTNLTQSAWINVGEAMTATNGSTVVRDTIHNGQRFYRLQLVE